MLYLRLSKQCKVQIQSSCFSCPLEFHHSKTKQELNDILEELKISREGVVHDPDSVAAKNVYGQKQKLDQLIVMGDASGLADTSNV